ncbi:MAG: ATP-binding protein, partial [Spirochaetota bacterium]
MKQIVVLSGKGGSGKTFVASSFAAIARDAVFADCDVDASNLGLMLDPVERSCSRFVSGEAASVDPARCTACGACVDACRFEAVRLTTAGSAGRERATAVVDPVACEGCGVCELVCPAGAVTRAPQERGEWFVSTTRFGTLVHASLRPGEENSGRLVDQVRREARTEAEREGLELVVIDGPPGTGCAARSAVTGTDYVVLVTEPTPSGVHDVRRAIELAQQFRVHGGMIVNKADLSSEKRAELRTIAREAGLDLLGGIPFSRRVPEALTRLEPYPLASDDAITVTSRRAWDTIVRRVSAGDDRLEG